jgi:hypothetical protein
MEFLEVEMTPLASGNARRVIVIAGLLSKDQPRCAWPDM